eukprot:726460_1
MIYFGFKAHTSKDPPEIATKIESNYNIEDITLTKASKLMIIVDRRTANETKYDSMYMFAYHNNDRFSELKSNVFTCFRYNIIRNTAINGNRNRNKTAIYFRFGLNGMTRFFPQMLVSMIMRFFRTPKHLSTAEYLHKAYSNKFKNGWCVTLDDETFEKYYKMITGFTHVSVNYNRRILYHEFHQNK